MISTVIKNNNTVAIMENVLDKNVPLRMIKHTKMKISIETNSLLILWEPSSIPFWKLLSGTFSFVVLLGNLLLTELVKHIKF